MNYRKQVMVAGLVTGALVLSACGSDSDSDVEVEGAWARTSPMAVTLGAAYFDLTVAEDDRLVAASVSSDVAGRAEIHEVVASDDEMSDDMDMSEEMTDDMDDGDMEEGSQGMDDMDHEGMEGMMTMREVDGGLALAGGETVTFEPGGYHIMLIDLVDPLEVGEEFDITLDFESAEDTTVTVEVAETAP